MKLTPWAVWAGTDSMTAGAAAEFAQRVEHWGYSTLWIPEGYGRNSLVHASWLLANTDRLVVATGIANIYARDPMAMAAAQITLGEQSGGRFLLGIGVSHAVIVETTRGHRYGKPMETMRSYLQGMKSATYMAPVPTERSVTVLAALGPKMLALAAAQSDGAHPYNVTPEHTAEARAILGPGKLLCPEQKVLLETDPATARRVIRQFLTSYLSLSNYCSNFLRMGFTNDDLAGGGSDRLVDALVAWGDEDIIRARLQQHLDAGADQVCINSIHPERRFEPDERVLKLFAPT
jgi:probable F420-dependent oxidoreductase